MKKKFGGHRVDRKGIIRGLPIRKIIEQNKFIDTDVASIASVVKASFI